MKKRGGLLLYLVKTSLVTIVCCVLEFLSINYINKHTPLDAFL